MLKGRTADNIVQLTAAVGQPFQFKFFTSIKYIDGILRLLNQFSGKQEKMFENPCTRLLLLREMFTVCLGNQMKCIHTYIHIYMHIYIYTCIHIYLHSTYIHACIHTYVHTYMHAYIHTYVHTYMHIYIHT